MNKLIIITGVSGTGKTNLANILYEKIENSILLSYDKLSENIYDLVGFKDKSQKKQLQLLNERIYKDLIEQCMKRKDSVIILEKPFRIEWKEFFEKLSRKYEYEVYTINMFSKNFETIWKRLKKREMSKKDRHPSHYLNSYYLKNREGYLPFFEYDYDKFKEEYDKLLVNSINLENVINVEDIDGLDINKLIAKLLN